MSDNLKDLTVSQDQWMIGWLALMNMDTRVKMESSPAISSATRIAAGLMEYEYDTSGAVSRTSSEDTARLKRSASPSAAAFETITLARKKTLTSRERRNQERYEAYQLSRAAGFPATIPSALNMLEIVETGDFVYAHKVILAQCERFLQWMTSPLMTNSVLMLDSECGSPLAQQALMHFIYDNRYESQTGDTTMSSDWSDFSNHADVYTFATQKGLVGLQDAVVARMTAWNRPWVPVPNFARALRLIWTSPLRDDDVLKPRLTLLCLRNLKDLATYPGFRQVMEDTPLRATSALAMIFDDRGQRAHLVRCPCGRLLDQKGRIQCLGCNRSNNDALGALPVEYYVRI
ncbi:hypothetical protein B0A48_13205 [Cryoendolithus antarcticus]|uniref:BTB domain-containing protein n=1 Tax=Cryoendolithus antarcticus TaxID=1507870 RepID=A0A1V8SNS6_9PEZI|nr:hypothetical protein B0A48_13205 [Cryoendolithus antarcticus]